MGKEENLLEYWRELSPEAQEKVLEFAKSLKLAANETEKSETEDEFVPTTPLGKKLWEIRQRAISNGMKLLTEDELEQELAERRSGYREP